MTVLVRQQSLMLVETIIFRPEDELIWVWEKLPTFQLENPGVHSTVSITGCRFEVNVVEALNLVVRRLCSMRLETIVIRLETAIIPAWEET